MKIAFHSVNCLFDPVSGAAKSVRALLEGLATRGHQVQSITAACFDRPDHPDEGDMLTSIGFAETEAGWQRIHNGITHTALTAGASVVPGLSYGQLAQSARDSLDLLEEFAPDLVISYGGTPAELAVRAHMSRRHTPIAFYLANPNYKDRACFKDVDLIMCDTLATANHYRLRLGLESEVIGKPIEPIKRIDGETPRYVTFINPAFEKGVTLFYRIAEMMAAHQPDIVFQVVESRSKLDSIQKISGMPFSAFANIRRAGAQRDMSRIYSRTKVLLIPSLWHESGPRVALEAMSLGIPLVASDHIGVRKAVEGAGTLITVPQKLRNIHRLIPPPRVALPWVAAIERLMTDEESAKEARQTAKANWQKHISADPIANLENFLKTLVEQG